MGEMRESTEMNMSYYLGELTPAYIIQKRNPSKATQPARLTALIIRLGNFFVQMLK